MCCTRSSEIFTLIMSFFGLQKDYFLARKKNIRKFTSLKTLVLRYNTDKNILFLD